MRNHDEARHLPGVYFVPSVDLGKVHNDNRGRTKQLGQCGDPDTETEAASVPSSLTCTCCPSPGRKSRWHDSTLVCSSTDTAVRFPDNPWSPCLHHWVLVWMFNTPNTPHAHWFKLGPLLWWWALLPRLAVSEIESCFSGAPTVNFYNGEHACGIVHIFYMHTIKDLHSSSAHHTKRNKPLLSYFSQPGHILHSPALNIASSKCLLL